MYGGALPVASKKKRKLTKEEYLSEAEDNEEASEHQKKKAKKAKVAGSNVQSIQQEVQDLEPAKVLQKRTRGRCCEFYLKFILFVFCINMYSINLNK